MAHNKAPTIAGTTLAAILAFTIAAPAAAEDFTFRIPLEVSRFAPGITGVRLEVYCLVSRALYRGRLGLADRDKVAEERFLVTLGPGPVNTSEVVTVAMNALNPRFLPASEARYYGCGIASARLTFPEGDTETISDGPIDSPSFGADYTTLTRHRLTTMVLYVQGEIPR